MAEVLITSGIIGVIATLTLPTLMTNVAEKEYSTAMKKGIGMFTEAIQLNVAMENISFDEMTDEESDLSATDTSSFVSFLNNRMQVDSITSKTTAASICAPGYTSGANCISYGGATDSFENVVYFRDGSALMFDATMTSDECASKEGDIANVKASTAYCIKGVYDTNGNKKPNLVANCSSNKTKTWVKEKVGDKDEDGKSNGVKCDKDTFVARDQYPLIFTGIAVYPGSLAAEYIFEKK